MRKFLLTLALAAVVSALSAQQDSSYVNVSGDRYQVLTNPFNGNWFFSFGGGAEVLYGDNDQVGKYKDRIAPSLNFSIGKWFTPALGVRLQYSGLQLKGFSYDQNIYTTGNKLSEGYYKQKFKYMNLHGDVLLNLNALFGGYNEKRAYEIIPYLGVGVTHSYDESDKQSITANFGIINRIRLASAWDLNLELNSMLTEDKFDAQLGGKGYDAVIGASLGFTYRFSPRGFIKPKVAIPVKQYISELELRDLRATLTSQATENMELKSKLNTQALVVEKQVIVEEANIAPRSVFFSIGSAKLSSQELVNLEFLADQMKKFTSLKFTLVGYADSKTGTMELNKKLSLQRAQAVVDALVGTYGIDRERLSTDAVGGVAKYDKEYLNRMVLIEMVK